MIKATELDIFEYQLLGQIWSQLSNSKKIDISYDDFLEIIFKEG